jgi:hypothetical protein
MASGNFTLILGRAYTKITTAAAGDITPSNTNNCNGGTYPRLLPVSLPSGLSLAVVGGSVQNGFSYNIAGTPTSLQDRVEYSFAYYRDTISNQCGFNIIGISVVNPRPPVISSGSFSGAVGVEFSQTLTVQNGNTDAPPTSWSVTNLPSGLSFNTATGNITGTPTTQGTFSASFTATNIGGTSSPKTVTFTIAYGAPIIVGNQTLSGYVGEMYNKVPTLSDSTNRPATSWSATGLPSWATFNTTTGAITGSPITTERFTTTLTATGPGGVSSDTTATVNIGVGPTSVLFIINRPTSSIFGANANGTVSSPTTIFLGSTAVKELWLGNNRIY